MFNGYRRTSLYVPARDGVRLAVDVFRPTLDGELHPAPLPAVLSMTPYNRASLVEGRLVHALSAHPGPGGQAEFNNLEALCLAGYLIVVFDVRGQGASFGAFSGCFTRQEGRDGADLIAWLGEQPWCTGRVGMLGSSYGGQTQFLVAAERPAGLQALFACHSLFDAYDVHFPGGWADLQIPSEWAAMVDGLAGRSGPSAVAPVDGGEAELAQALAEHRAGPSARTLFEQLFESRLRDGNGYFDTLREEGPQNLCALLPLLREARIPAWHWGGWNDYYPGQAAMWFCNWQGFAPSRLTIGPWSHSPRAFTSERDREDLRLRLDESLRWFDRWLKDVDNGVEDEAPVHYAMQQGHPYRDFEAPESFDWRVAEQWPIAEDSARVEWNAKPRSQQVDMTLSTGKRNRMGAGFRGVAVELPQVSADPSRCLSWTGPPLAQALSLAGTPQVRFELSADVPDLGLALFLEDVGPEGRATLITYGLLRASHRAVADAPYGTAGALWHPGTRAAVEATPPLDDGQRHAVAMSLLPVANCFAAGHRLRLTLSGADDGNLLRIAGRACLTVWSSATLDLPILLSP